MTLYEGFCPDRGVYKVIGKELMIFPWEVQAQKGKVEMYIPLSKLIASIAI